MKNRLFVTSIAVLSFIGLAFEAIGQFRPRGPQFQSPEVNRDGTVAFRVLAPNAQSVSLSGSDIPGLGREGQAMEKNDERVWKTSLAIAPGYYRYNFNIDGVSVIDPKNPATSESNGNTWSLVGVPGAEFMDTKKYPMVP